jgi:hypothetical protein
VSRISITIIKDSGKAYQIKNNQGHIAWMPHNWVRDDLTVKETTFAKNNEEFEVLNKILLKDTGKQVPCYDPDDLVQITQNDLDKIVVGNSGIKHSQLAILDIYPLQTGWKEKLVGTFICRRRLELAKQSQGVYLRNERIIACMYDEPRLIKVYEEELENSN